MVLFFFLLIFLIVLIVGAICSHIDKKKKASMVSSLLKEVGLSQRDEVSFVDVLTSVKSHQALEKYDDIRFFKENDKLSEARAVIERKNALRKRINEFLKENNYPKDKYYHYAESVLLDIIRDCGGYGIRVEYITSAGNCRAAKNLLVDEKRLIEIETHPEYLMTKTEYNQMVKQLTKDELEYKRKTYYERVNAVIDTVNESQDKLIVRKRAERLEELVRKLFEGTVNSIQKVKSPDSEEWEMLNRFITDIEMEVDGIIEEDRRIEEYYESDNFRRIKSTCDSLMQSQKEFNEYINEKAEKISNLFGKRIVRNETETNDVYNYIRAYKKTITPYTAEVSATVFSSAENNPIPYIIKYFYPNRGLYKIQAEQLRTLIEELETLKEAKDIIENYKKDYAEYIKDVPEFILEKDENGFYRRLGFATIDENVLEVAYKFVYTSNGGMAQRSFTVPMTEETIIELINQLESRLSTAALAKEQRAMMTSKLRAHIKERDNFTCCHCGNSTHQEPNLLLEIDHIIPVSKGGLTEETNLQTLCWKCNRAKSNKIIA